MSLWRRILVERRRVVWPLALVLAANVAAVIVLVWPLGQGVVAAETDRVAALADLAAARREEQHARSARESTQSADEDLRRFFETVLPQGFDGAVQVTGFWLTRVAARTGVQFERGTYDADAIDDSELSRMIAKASLTGDYAGVRRFLHAVESAPEFVMVDRMELAEPDDQGDGQLELLLDISTVFRHRRPAGDPGGGR